MKIRSGKIVFQVNRKIHFKFMKYKNILILILFVITGIGHLDAQNALIEVQSAVDTAEIYIGDLINYSITIKKDKNLRIEQPGQGLNLGSFEIKDYNFSEPQEEDGIVILRYDYYISVFDTGKFTIPAYPVAYFPDSTNNYKIIEAASIDISVKSILSGEEAPELKDIKPPIEIPVNWSYILTMLGILLAIIAAIYFGYKAWKKKQEKGYIFTPPPKPRPAHELALEALKDLYATDLVEKQEHKKFFSQLSEIIRTYLENRYFISALEETTFEIMIDLKKHLNEENELLIKRILELSDLVKFAKLKPLEGQITSVKEESVLFVEQTKIIFNEGNGTKKDEQAVANKLLVTNKMEDKGD